MPRVLVVDDTDDIRELVATLLQRKGFDVTTAVGGRQGVAQASSDQPDLILMDLNMPDMDGWRATREIREAGIPTPVIALTAHMTAEDQARAAAAGFDGFQTKPLELDNLLAMIEELLSARKIDT
ncbi:MAG: response regulator [Planctomycetaceae bacterium]|nr:response regulator [Planctomycetaceae bacterium]